MDNQDEPLHSGEIYHLWSYLNQAKYNNTFLQVLINHTEEVDLKDFLEEIFENVFQEEEQELESILKELGIRLPPAPPDRPNVEVEDIPAGARFNDPEIAHMINKELENGKFLCSFMTGLATKEYMETLFHEFHSLRAEFNNKLFRLAKKKGWSITPPVHIK